MLPPPALYTVMSNKQRLQNLPSIKIKLMNRMVVLSIHVDNAIIYDIEIVGIVLLVQYMIGLSNESNRNVIL